MGDQSGEMRQAIELAIYREIGARNFYRRISEEIENSDGKEKFAQLSVDEDGHRVKLESWYEKLTGSVFAPDHVKLAESEIQGYDVDGKAGALQALNIAIDAEEMANRFYVEQSEKAKDPELKSLFEKLADEESGHFALLEAERNSIIGGFYWFDMDETTFLED